MISYTGNTRKIYTCNSNSTNNMNNCLFMSPMSWRRLYNYASRYRACVLVCMYMFVWMHKWLTISKRKYLLKQAELIWSSEMWLMMLVNHGKLEHSTPYFTNTWQIAELNLPTEWLNMTYFRCSPLRSNAVYFYQGMPTMSHFYCGDFVTCAVSSYSTFKLHAFLK